MRKFILPIIVITLVAFSGKFTADNSTASVNQVQGCYIFVDSKPIAEYEYLGTVEVRRVNYGSQYQPVRDALIKEAKKKYPSANGIVFHFFNGGRDKADAI